MKKIMLLAIAVGALLAGCARAPDEEALLAPYRAADEITARAEVGVLLDGAAMVYTIDYRKADGQAVVTLLAPEALSGISATLNGQAGRAAMEYQGVSLETLMPGIPGFSPADGLDGVLRDLALGAAQARATVRLAGQPCLMLTYGGEHEGEALEKQVWLELETGAVRRCAFFINGRQTMVLDVTELAIF